MSIQSKLPFFARIFRAAAHQLLPKQHPGAPGIGFSLRQACLNKKEVCEGCLRRGKSAGGGAAVSSGRTSRLYSGLEAELGPEFRAECLGHSHTVRRDEV